MSEAILDPIFRKPPDMMVREIRERRQTLDRLRTIAGEFAARDLRPIYVMPDGTLHATRDFNIPEALTTLMRHEARAIAELELQLWNLLSANPPKS